MHDRIHPHAFSLRLHCPIDTSLSSRHALAYADTIVAADLDLEIVAHSFTAIGELAGDGWGRHAKHFMPHVGADYVNVVMGSPQDWRRYWTQPTRQRHALSARNRCLGNVLIATDLAPIAEYIVPGWTFFGAVTEPDEVVHRVVGAYDLVVVMAEEICSGYQALHHPHRVVVVPPLDAAAFQVALQGALPWLTLPTPAP